ncbi:hypothetical protein [Mycobacterium terramassiliense]|uniref:Mycobacterium terramassiliense ORFan n=1 Tax=Mycobacterium terramassiliense TaxID=1841859 RepID=A0A2U3NKH3_9MYCO|nr:hypothetical protein [Mycobacterium terramassiliense]SPM32037.1 Mycobacterium terramassiliense ORFan [Mycobacterium terramassiliense]
MTDAIRAFLAEWDGFIAHYRDCAPSDIDECYRTWLVNIEWLLGFPDTCSHADELLPMWRDAIRLFGARCVMDGYERSGRSGDKVFAADTAYWVRLFKMARDPSTLPTKPVTLYRGCYWAGRLRPSWTPNLVTAYWYAISASCAATQDGRYVTDFSNRYRAPRIYRHVTRPPEILAVRRDNDEYVLDPTFLDDSNVEEIWVGDPDYARVRTILAEASGVFVRPDEKRRCSPLVEPEARLRAILAAAASPTFDG